MPLNIVPVPAILSGVGSSAPAETPPVLPANGTGATLFVLLLAQTTKTPKGSTASILTKFLPPTTKSKGTKSSGGSDPTASASPVPSPAWPEPIPLTPGAAPPVPDKALLIDEKTIVGKAMDTVPIPGGELLPIQTLNNAPGENSPVSPETASPAVSHLAAAPRDADVAIRPVASAVPTRQAALQDGLTVPSAPQSPAVPLPHPSNELPVLTNKAEGSSAAGDAPIPLPVPTGDATQPSVTLSQGVSPLASAPRQEPHTAVAPPVPGASIPLVSSPTIGVPWDTVPRPSALPPAKGDQISTTARAAAASGAEGVVTLERSSPLGLQKPARSADNQASKNAGMTVTATARGEASLATVAVGGTATWGAGQSGLEKAATKVAVMSGQAAKTLAELSPVPTVETLPLPVQSQGVTPMPAADQARMLRQVAHGMETMIVRTSGNGQQQVTLQLHPKDWGQLNVSVSTTPTTATDGTVSTQVVAHVVAEHPAVKAALEGGRTELAHALREAGLKLDRLTVTVQPPSAGSETNAGNSRPQSPSGGGWGQAAQSGTSTQGGSASGGQNPSAFAAFGDGQPGRRPQSPVSATVAPSAVPEGDDDPVPAAAPVGRWDTRA